ncbi:hypothetical protein HMPREF1487_09341 [Pseudomonas sp. HPB0071]|uniref:Conjugal transfer protein TraX n=1 Tax=Pseudomonas luteola TaxID=47886 RepID=A0ABS0MZ17_PSELU|nr:MULTISPECIES: TraX family protein [Pseudomonas]ENA27128.1 hypothetical protein HMPREF1487_09341 [Pseudomonas sp. HPB0071]MBA1250081.1 conjugal transfer protein TraX [Pseudomonas zeshuii]MBH3441710.1 conjugal transfer protein TraX [Pseudomonas luteola]
MLDVNVTAGKVQAYSVNLAVRDKSLDLIKWLALVTMVVGHLRILMPDTLSWTVVPGRAAFPLFALILAANVLRQPQGRWKTRTNSRYLMMLATFALISQPGYGYAWKHSGGNILFTLLLGLLLVLMVRHGKSNKASFLRAVTLIIPVCLISDNLEYGLSGVLLPSAFLMALQKEGKVWWLLPAMLAAMANTSDFETGLALIIIPLQIIDMGEAKIYLELLVAIGGSLLGLWIKEKRLSLDIPPVGSWGYAFYPAHMGLLVLVHAAFT